MLKKTKNPLMIFFFKTFLCWNKRISSRKKNLILTNICSSKSLERDKSWLQQQHYFSSAGNIAVNVYSRIYHEKNDAIVVAWVNISLIVIQHYILCGSDLLSVQEYYCYSWWISYFHTITCKWTTDLLRSKGLYLFSFLASSKFMEQVFV